MYDIMSKKVKGKHAFCALTQSHGATALNPSLRGKEREKDIGVPNDELIAIANLPASSKRMEMDLDLDGSDDEPVAITKPSALTMDPIPIPSSASASSSKHKYTTLGEDDSAMSGSLNSYNSGKWKPHSSALDGVKESLDLIGTAICELAFEHKFY